MALRISEEDLDDQGNPGRQHAADLVDREKNGAKNNDSLSGDGGGDSSSLNDAEKNQDNPLNYNPSKDQSKKVTAGQYFGFIKKKGPLALILSFLLTGTFGLSVLFSPGLLLVQIKETMVNAFNVQFPSMASRGKLLNGGLGTTEGICGSVLTIGCKYTTMTTEEVTNFETAGIKINSKSKTFFGRVKPDSFEFDNKIIKPSQFAAELDSNPSLSSAVNTAYDAKAAGFLDSFWEKIGLSKAKPNLDTSSDENALKSVQEDTKTNSTVQEDTAQPIKEGDTKPDGVNKYTAAEAKAANTTEAAANAAESEIAKDSAKIAETGVKGTSSLLKTAEIASNTLKITGIADAACSVYGGVKALGYAAKVVRVLQLAKYALLFLNVADQIKAGDAKAEDVSYLGKVLTTEVNGKSATDSFGYKYAAYGDLGTMPNSASQFMAGGGLTGQMIGLTTLIDKYLPDKTICGTLKNPFVMGGSLIVGLGMFLIPGGQAAVAAWDVAKGVATAALVIGSAFIPALLKDVVAGVLVDKTTVGESAGDAITSGASGMMGSLAKAGGNAPLTPDQALAYNKLSNDIAAQYAEEDRLARSPFDVTSKNTFLGSILSKLTPYIYKSSSISSTIASIASFTATSFSSIISPVTMADDSIAQYQQCQDYDYKALNLATDPYCNVRYGISPNALKANPIKVINSLGNEIDQTTGDPTPGSAYAQFVDNCITRSRPLGDVGENTDTSDGSECVFGKKVAIAGSTQSTNDNYYLHYIDQRVYKDKSGEDKVLAAAKASGAYQKGISFYSNIIDNSTAVNMSGGY